jgi:alkylation response protein AidB-like acyl-CoA dehydrogenase
MTDGAARLLELHPDEATRSVFERLTTRDPARFWTSGQWMTERTGGSDVASTTTIARRVNDGAYGYRLVGTKWFTSATTSQVAITLARIEGAPPGGRGLSVFLVRLRDDDESLRGIRVNRLKDKLGTRALPTAELSLEETPAHLVGGAGDGIRKIAALFNVTRVYNAVAAVAGMRRAIALAHDYATKRIAFGKPILQHPLHAETLAALEVEWAAGFHLAFRVVELLGRQECDEASESEAALLRLMIPVAKLYTAKQAVAVASEALESFGGAGYIEDTGLPRLLRDAQVLSIWEGTTNVLSLDVLRAIEKTNALAAFIDDVRQRLGALPSPVLGEAAARVDEALLSVEAFGERLSREGRDFAEVHARRFAYAIARVWSASLMLEHASHQSDESSARIALRWCAGNLAPLEASELVF